MDAPHEYTATDVARLTADPHWRDDFPPLLTPEQCAEMVQVPVRTVYDWSSRKLLVSCSAKIGRHLRIDRDRFIQHVLNGGLRGQE